jgi:hypothetical protein
LKFIIFTLPDMHTYHAAARTMIFLMIYLSFEYF